jgi:hypothetical protein
MPARQENETVTLVVNSRTMKIIEDVAAGKGK